MMDITLYSTGCAKCSVLEAKLDAKKIEYKKITDMDVMEAKGFMSVPMLEVNGEVMSFKKAVDWVNAYEGDMT